MQDDAAKVAAALEALAVRCEQAAGPDRELDNAIRDALGSALAPRFVYSRRYTASLDAARTLVPELHTMQLSDWDHEILRAKGAWQAIVLPMGARGSMKDFTFTNRCDHAATLALALCAASLRARAAIIRQEEGK